VAPLVVSVIVTVCAVLYCPVAGLITGVAVVVYVVMRVRRHLLARSREAAPGRNVERVGR